MAETFKARMRRIRTRAGFKSQADAATAIGCERGTVSMWEAPSSPVNAVSEEYLFGVAKAYRVDPQWINKGGPHDGFDGAPTEREAPYSGKKGELRADNPKAVNPIGKSQTELVRIVSTLAGQLTDTEAKAMTTLISSLAASRMKDSEKATQKTLRLEA